MIEIRESFLFAGASLLATGVIVYLFLRWFVPSLPNEKDRTAVWQAYRTVVALVIAAAALATVWTGYRSPTDPTPAATLKTGSLSIEVHAVDRDQQLSDDAKLLQKQGHEDLQNFRKQILENQK
jgi:hypothetical protein